MLDHLVGALALNQKGQTKTGIVCVCVVACMCVNECVSEREALEILSMDIMFVLNLLTISESAIQEK